MNKGHIISDYVNVASRYLRSVNLESDSKNYQSYEGYIITPNVAQSLNRLFSGLLNENGQKAYTLIGPYGSGKSAFAVYLSQILAIDDKVALEAQKLLATQHPELAMRVAAVRTKVKGITGYLPILLTARRRPISLLILEALAKALGGFEKNQYVLELAAEIDTALEKKHWKDSDIILSFFDQVAKESQKQNYSGMLLLIDEAGKTLEYALQDRVGGDVYIFQQLAEKAARSTKFPFLFLITLHQMFDDYVELSERTVRAEWTKVQERFQAIQFSESAATIIKMLADAIQPVQPIPKSVMEAIERDLSKLTKANIPLPVGIDNDLFHSLAKKAWPLHPTVLLAVPHLFRRLAQNERSIFSYLTSHEPLGFQEHIQKHIDQDNGFIRLNDLYSYLLANFEVGLARLPYAKKLLEANDVLNSRHNLSRLSYDLIKTVAMLNVLGEISPIRATIKFLECAAGTDDLEAELYNLKKQSVLTYRNLDGSYRVWEGSDVDIEARMKEARRHLQLEGHSLLDTLHRHLPEKHFVARKHNLETGAYRYFNVSYSEYMDLSEKYGNLNHSGNASGTIIVILPVSDISDLIKKALEVTHSVKHIIVAIPKQIDALKGVVEEVACLRWVERNTEELRDDRVARRELSLRLVEGEQKISQLLQTLLDPRPAPFGNSCLWIWNGENHSLRTKTDVTRLISEACESIYQSSPRLRNELISRKTISSAAAAARRNLMEKMLTCANQEKLGIEGFPPERSIYESALFSSGIHKYNSSKGCWEIAAPSSDSNVNFGPSWSLLEKEIFNDNMQKVLVKDVFSLLASPPLGVPDGIHPLLFTAFFIYNQDDLFLYREGSFIPEPNIAHFELLQKRPDLFKISGIRLEGVRAAVVERIANGLNTPSKTSAVVKALFRVLNSLPLVTQRTSKLEPRFVIKMRNAFFSAQSPEDLLFVDLPNCFGLKPFLSNDNRNKDINLFFEKLNICLSTLQTFAPNLLANCKKTFLTKCELSQDEAGWKELAQRATWLSPRVNHEVLTPFLNSIVNGISDNHNPVPALSFVAKKTFEQWSDLDIDRFPGFADGISRLFNKFWYDYGDPEPELSEKELQIKSNIYKDLKAIISDKHDADYINAYKAAIKQILADIENVKN